MCLAVPGEVVRWLERTPPFCQAEIQFDGIRRVCNMSCVPDAEVGQYVIVHAGVAISKVDAQAVEEILAQFARLALFEEDAENPS